MKTTINNHLTYRLFIGCLLTSEIRMHLHQSKTWKQVAILPANSQELVEVHHNTKDYFGLYSHEKNITLDSLNKTAIAIRERLHFYCPNCELSSVKIYIFSQVFVA